MKEYKNALNNLAEFMKGLQEENQKLKDENKELKSLRFDSEEMKSWLMKKELYEDFIKDVYGFELPKSLRFDSEEKE